MTETNKNDISELRTHLFDTLKGLKDKSVSPQQAKAVTEVSAQIINTAKVEIDFIKATGAKNIGSEFLPSLAVPKTIGSGTVTQLPGRTVHKIGE